jgi:hypothetical protein
VDFAEPGQQSGTGGPKGPAIEAEALLLRASKIGKVGR